MRVGYVAQEPQLELDKTVRENLQAAIAPIQELVDRYNAVADRLGEAPDADEMDKLLDEMGELQDEDRRLRRLGDRPHDRHRRRRAGPAARRHAGAARSPAASGGAWPSARPCWKSPTCCCSTSRPTTSTPRPSTGWKQALREYPGTVIIVTHDRYFLDNITKWILELEDGRGLPFEGNYSSWLAQKAELLRVIEKKRDRSASGRSSASWRGSNSSVQGRQHEEPGPHQASTSSSPARPTIDTKSDALIQIAPGPRLGEKVLSFDGVAKGFGDLTLLKDCSFDLPRGAIVGVIGPNGTGKTTLFRMIIGQEKPDAGTIDARARRVVLSYVDQHRDALEDDRTPSSRRSPAARTRSSSATSR